MSLPSKPELISYRSDDTLRSTATTLCDDARSSDNICNEKGLCSSGKTSDEVASNVPQEIKGIGSKANSIIQPEPEFIDTVPDGGLRAWLVVVGITLCVFTAFGCISTWGAFQAYYESTFLKQLSPTKIAWIGSVQYALVFTPSMIVGRLFDKGYYHSLFLTFSVILVLSTVLLAECKVYWHFLVCQGFMSGLSCGVLTAPTPAILSQWFKERRALAFGITACGSAIGGTVFPILIRALLPQIGFQWTMRALALIMCVCLSAAGLLMRRRLPPSHPTGPLLGLEPLKTPAFVTWCFATMFVYFGFYTFQSYVASTAVSKGFSETFSFALVAIMNGGSGLGRILAGIIANHIGSINHMIPATTLTVIIVLAWPFATTPSSLIAISALYGITAGSFAALLWHPIMDLGKPDELSRRVGILMLFLACAGLLGSPMSGEVNRTAGNHAMSIFAGGCMFVGIVLASFARYMMLGRCWGKL